MNFSKNKLKNIMVIGTGGTIAGTGESGKTLSYQSGQIEVNDLISEIPDLKHIANVTSNELLSIDSCDITCRDWIHLTNYINETAESDEFDGFVITHGTDTLEETAFFLNLTVKTSKPVVITGSMRPSTAMSPDGPFNIFQAVALASSEEAVGKGVLVAFSDTIYEARDVQKINTFRVSAFSQRDLGCLGYIRDDKVYFYASSTKKHTYNSEFDVAKISELPNVSIAPFYADANTNILDYLRQNSQGIILSGAGCGGCSTIWDKKIQEFMSDNFPVVRSSRISNGLVTSEYISQKGIFSNTLSPQKSRILLSLALTKTNSIEKIRSIFETY